MLEIVSFKFDLPDKVSDVIKILKEPLISIIIINFNGQEYLKECFDSIKNLNYSNIEIILIDNGSKDNSVEFIKNNYRETKIIQLKKNYGFAKPNNIAASLARGQYIALLNNDVRVEKNWLTELVKVAEISDKIGIVASKIYYYDNPEVINYAGGYFEKYGYSRHIGSNFKDNEFFNTQRETFFGCGAALLIKRELVERIGLFDPIYFAYCEDLDLCWRAWLSGYKVMYAPNSFIYHKIGRVMENQLPKRLYLNERNRLRTLLKNYEILSLIKVLPIYFKRRISLVKENLFIRTSKQNFGLFFLLIYIKAMFWNFYHLHSLIINRKKIRIFRKKRDKFLFQLMENTYKNWSNLMKIK